MIISFRLMSNCWKMTPKDRANMRQIQGELNRLAGNQKVRVSKLSLSSV